MTLIQEAVDLLWGDGKVYKSKEKLEAALRRLAPENIVTQFNGLQLEGIIALRNEAPRTASRIFQAANARAEAVTRSIGYFAVRYPGEGMGTELLADLLKIVDQPVYATVQNGIESYSGLVRLLKRFGFVEVGHPWPSTARPGTNLSLLVRN